MSCYLVAFSVAMGTLQEKNITFLNDKDFIVHHYIYTICSTIFLEIFSVFFFENSSTYLLGRRHAQLVIFSPEKKNTSNQIICIRTSVSDVERGGICIFGRKDLSTPWPYRFSLGPLLFLVFFLTQQLFVNVGWPYHFYSWWWWYATLAQILQLLTTHNVRSQRNIELL